MQLPSVETFFLHVLNNNHHWLKFLTFSIIMSAFIPDRDSYKVLYSVVLSQVPTKIESEYVLSIYSHCKMCEQSSGSTSAVHFF